MNNIIALSIESEFIIGNFFLLKFILFEQKTDKLEHREKNPIYYTSL